MSARVVDIRQDEYGTYEDVRPQYGDGDGRGTRPGRFAFLRKGYVDYALVLIVFFLAIFGLIMLFSTSSYEAGLKYDNPSYYMVKQMKAILLGLFVMFIISFWPDYHSYKTFAIPLYLLAAGLLLLIIPFGVEAGGAKRWLNVGISIQPAEVAKAAMIIFIASFLCGMREKAASLKGLGVIFGFTLPIAGFIYFITDNLSSAFIVVGIAFVMLFVTTPGYRYYLLIVGLGLLAVYGIVFYILNYTDPSVNFRFARIFAWRDLEAYASGKGYQTLQSLYAIGSGGIFGKGLGQSIQKTGFIPEAQNDMIFSIVCEELGLFGGLAVIIMFFMLLWRMMIIANNAPDLFGSLIVVGVMGHIAIQVILNIAVVTNVIPNTGITLPFISYGGSAVTVQLAEIGMVMNVARRIQV